MGMLLTYRPGYYPGDALEDDDKREQVEEAGAHGDTPGAEAADAGEHPDTEPGEPENEPDRDDEPGQPDPENAPEDVEDADADDSDESDAEDEPADWDDLTDEQVAEAYAVNVGGNATSRRGQVKALRKLDDDSSE